MEWNSSISVSERKISSSEGCTSRPKESETCPSSCKKMNAKKPSSP